MSLHGFQTALAAIIRHPRLKYKWEPEVFFKNFELSGSERKIIETLSQHKELNKYGKDQANGRLEVMYNHCDRVPRQIPDRVLKNIWFDLFEPTIMKTPGDLKGSFETSLAFLNFLATDKEARKRLKRSAPYFIFDLIKFEIAELELSRPILLDAPLKAESVLSHPHFRVIDLEFDVPAWLASSEDEDEMKFERSMTLVFVKGSESYPKIFEITPEYRNFLLSQISGEQSIDMSVAMKSDLVKMGLILQH